MKKRSPRCILSIAAIPLFASAALAGQIPLKKSSLERQNTDQLSLKRYVAAGDRAYVVGIQDGTFPPIGWHITGHMGGVWAQPLKLLESYRFLLNDQPLPASNKFVSGAGYVRLEFPATDGLAISRTEFSPDGLPVVLAGLRLQNLGNQVKTFKLTIKAQSELLPPYPWSGTEPTSDQLKAQDRGSYDSSLGAIEFIQEGKTFHALVAAALDARDRNTGFESLGASFPRTVGKDALGSLSYRVTMQAGSTATIWFAIAGSHTAKSEAAAALKQGLNFPQMLLDMKTGARRQLVEQTQLQVPDQVTQDAFDWGKLNLADMRRKVHDAAIRDTQEGEEYPAAPIIQIPSLSGFGAGYPDYPWYFGTDGAYTSFSLVVTGQWDAAKDHLNLLRQVSRAVNGVTGKVLHEIVCDGSIYFGTNAQAGDTNETPEFATAVANLWRWSGDNSVRDDNYDFIKDGLRYVTTELDVFEDGWPEGAGMVEASGMGAKKLDVAVYTIRALDDLAEMAASKSDSATHNWAKTTADTLRSKFDHDWWMPSKNLYADSLELNVFVPTDPPAAIGTAPVTKLEQYFWTNATPMETGIALPNRAAAAFPFLESPSLTGKNGFYQQAALGGRQSSAVNTGVMAIAETNYGREDEALRYVRLVARELDVEQPGALPELFDSPDYRYFQAFTGRAMVMQAWSSYGIHWPIVVGFLGVRPSAPTNTLTVVPSLPSAWPELSVSDLKIGSAKVEVSARQAGKQYQTTVVLPQGWNLTIGYALPAGSQVNSVTLNNQPAAYQIVDSNRGREVHVVTNVAGTQSLQIMVK
jgi:glycogen debranching enzyme